jgi:hypothetical protein
MFFLFFSFHIFHCQLLLSYLIDNDQSQNSMIKTLVLMAFCILLKIKVQGKAKSCSCQTIILLALPTKARIGYCV